MSQQQWHAEAVEAEEQALGLGDDGGGHEGGNRLRDYYFDDGEEGLDDEELRAAGLL
jgi:hypothetical protein